MKKLLILMLMLTLSFRDVTALRDISIYLNNEKTYVDSPAYINHDRVFVPLRFMSSALGLACSWDEYSRMALISGDGITFRFLPDKSQVFVNGRKEVVSSEIKNGRIMVPLRFVSERMGAEVTWDGDNYRVNIKTDKTGNLEGTTTAPGGSGSTGAGSTGSGSSGSSGSGSTGSSGSGSTGSGSTGGSYTSDEVFWLSRIIHAESSGEPYSGMVAVGNVVLNRVKSPQYPNTIYGVIFDKKNGVQFEPTINGSIYNNPSNQSISAAKAALSGENYAGESLFFLNPKTAQSGWIVKNRVFYRTIGNHDFYI